MSETTELIAQQILNGNINKRTWGDILYNVKVYGATGNGTTDDTASIQATIDYAISVGGKAVFFPHGTYKVTSLTNLSSVVLFGDNASFSGISTTINQIGSATSNLVFNVKEYGAKGDGTTDDTNAVNAAINAAIANNGGIVFFPPGIYAIFGVLNTITKSGVYIVGSGKFSTFIQHRSDTADLIKIGDISTGINGTVSGSGVSNLSITHAPTRTAGISIYIENAQIVDIENVNIQNAFVFAQLGGPTDQYSGGVKLINVTGSLIGGGVAVDIRGGCNGIQLKSVELNNEYAGTAVRITPSARGLDTLFMDNCLFQRFAYGMMCNGTTGVIQNAFISNCVFDGIQFQSLIFSPTGDAIYARFQFVNCWFTSNTDDAVFIDATATALAESIVFSACRWITVNKRGLVINSQYPVDVSLDRCALSHCSLAGSGLYPAIQIANSGKRFSITNCKIGKEGTLTINQSYGIALGTGCDLYLISNNDLIGNVAGAISDSEGVFTTKQIVNNLGYNPVGSAVGVPAIPASGTPQKNTHAVPVEVFIFAGNVTSIAKNGAGISGMTSGSIILYPGETITVSYTVAPAWSWFGL